MKRWRALLDASPADSLYWPPFGRNPVSAGFVRMLPKKSGNSKRSV
jgi:hypothetical protein